MHEENPFTRAYFEDLFADNPDPWNFEQSEYERAKYQHTLSELPLPRFRRALEIGCANGALTVDFAPRCSRLVAVDVVESALARAKARLADQPHVEFYNMRTPYEVPDGPFDLVLLSEVACYWDDEGHRLMADYLRKVLEPDGHILLVHYTEETGYPKSGDEAVERLQHLLGDGFTSLKAQRRPGYRLDLWQRLPAAM
jgi:SAM-dependent methyltransferase